MTNDLLHIKLKNRLNKLASSDYDNFESWQIAEAFNKAQLEWVRRQVHGNNLHKEGNESSKMSIDDLQILLTEAVLKAHDLRDGFWQTNKLPGDYLYGKRMSAKAISDCCLERVSMVFYPVENTDIDILAIDENRKPSFEWRESYYTLQNNVVRLYTNGEFDLTSVKMMYYRKPKEVKFKGDLDLITGVPHIAHVECEFKDDITEIILDEAAALLAGDIESMMQVNRLKTNAQSNE